MKKLFITLTLAGAIICTITNNNLVAENLKNFEMASLTSLTDQENDGGESLTPSEGGDNFGDNDNPTPSEGSQGPVGLDCNYHRDPFRCEISVVGNAELELFHKGVLKADGDGKLYADGGVSCSRDGKSACTPIECIQVYQSLGI